MTTAKAQIEVINENECLGILRGTNGDYHELRGFTWNQLVRRMEDFCKQNEIALTELPHKEKVFV
jgi:hypothetical protein